MKKALFILMAVLIASCSSGRICGGSGEKRCVEITAKPTFKNIT